MSIRTERSRRCGSTALPAWTLAVGLLLIGCTSVMPTPQAAVETTNPGGFSITESARVGMGVRSEFDEATAAIEKKKFQRGIELLEEVVMTSPKLTAAHINLAIAYQQIEKFDLAEAALLRALEVNPKHPVAHNELGIVYRRTGRFEDARSSYEAALALHPEFHFARKNLAILCDLFISDLGCALEHYELYHEADPADEAAAIWIADLKNRAGRED